MGWTTLLGRALLTRSILHRILPGMAVCFMLALLTGLMGVVLLATALYVFYQCILAYGWQDTTALLLTLGLAFALEAGLIAVMYAQYRRISRAMMGRQAYASDIVEHFLKGLCER